MDKLLNNQNRSKTIEWERKSRKLDINCIITFGAMKRKQKGEKRSKKEKEKKKCTK